MKTFFLCLVTSLILGLTFFCGEVFQKVQQDKKLGASYLTGGTIETYIAAGISLADGQSAGLQADSSGYLKVVCQ